MKDTVKKYLSEASNFMYDDTISEAVAVDKKAEAVVIATEGKKEPTPASVAIKKAKLDKLKKLVVKEEEDEDVDADTLEDEDNEICEEEDDEAEDNEICEEEDDGAEDGEICEEDEQDEQITDDDKNKKKIDIKESYIAHASRWM